MKVLITTDNIGGVWTFSTDLAHGLRKMGIDVVLAVIGQPLTEGQKRTIQGIPYSHYVAQQEWMENPWEEVYAAGQWLYWFKQLENPDFIHLNSYTLACINWQVPVILTLHSCVLSWWEAVYGEKAPSKWDVYKRHVKAGIQSADYITAPSEFMMNAAEKHYGPFRSQKVIYNGRDQKLFLPGHKKKIVFSMGRLWDQAKNIKLLIEAAKEIDYPVYIAGEIDLESNAPVPPNVTLLGKLNQQEVAAWLSESRIYALPVKYEPFGYSFLEAAFSKCVLVGGDIQSQHEVWNDAMVYSSISNPSELAEAINNLMEDEKQMNNLSEKAFSLAVQKYRLDRMVKEYFSLYKKVERLKSKLLLH